MKKILITGATGFVGSNIFLNLKDKSNIYLLIRRKKAKKINLPFFKKKKNIKIIFFGDYDELRKKLKKIKVDIIIHCATHYIKFHKNSDISKIIESNIIFGSILIENLKNLKAKKFINFTTVWENYNGIKNNSFNLYSTSKTLFRKLLEFSRKKNKNIKFFNFFISDTYGSNDKRVKLINVLKKNYKKNKITKIISKNLYINLINIKDIIEAVNLVIKKNVSSGNYSLSNISDYKISKIIDKVNKKNKKIKIKWRSSKFIKEKIYKYKKIPFWKAKFSNLNNLSNFITN